MRWLKRTLAWVAGVLLLLASANWLWPLPLPEEGAARVVLAENGTPLWRFADAQGVWRYPVQQSEVSPLYIQALLTYEDRWFYQHPGINPLSFARALWQNLRGQRVISGGSTLSMQVARLLEPHPRTVLGKLRQVARTAQLEWHLSKDEILTLYLNYAPFGGTLQGVAAASWAYLGKPPSQLTPSEAALLAVLPQAPSRLRPDRHPQAASQARNKLLKRLQQFAVWPKQQVAEAMGEPVLLAPRQEPHSAPLLAQRLKNRSQQAVIRTTLDASLQARLEDLLQGWRAKLPERSSAAILVVESQNMAVRAYLGSLDIADDQRFGHVDMIRALRSPGSTLKPFLYGLALDAGLIHSESLLQDVPRRYGNYRPGNFAQGFIGPVSASTALASSLNLPAVQLLEAYGPKRFAGQLQAAGLPLVLPAGAEPNLAVILGGAGTRLEYLVGAYAALARQGKAAQPRYQPEQPLLERPLLSPGAAWIVRRILAGQARPERDPRAQLVQRPTLAWKTGTSYGFRDAWALGVAPRYVIGVWIGRPDGTPVAGQFGAAQAAPLLLQVHDVLVNRDAARGLKLPVNKQPASVSVAAICWPSGQALAERDSNCRRQRFAWVLDGTVPPTLPAGDLPLGFSLSQTLWVNAQGQQVDASCAGARAQKMDLWPAPLEPWLPRRERRAARMPAMDMSCPPHNLAQVEPLSIVGVRDGERLRRPAQAKAAWELKVSALGGSVQRWWFIDGQEAGRSQNNEALKLRVNAPGLHQISLLDDQGQTAQVRLQLLD